MAIAQTTATSIKNTFATTGGYVKDTHNGGRHGNIRLDGLVVRKNLQGEILNIGGFLLNKSHCINEVCFINDQISLSTISLTGGIYANQATSPDEIVDILNSNEKHLAEVVHGEQQNMFWSVL